jgi:hypothetical protein
MTEANSTRASQRAANVRTALILAVLTVRRAKIGVECTLPLKFAVIATFMFAFKVPAGAVL